MALDPPLERQRFVVLPSQGPCLVSTDLHGNLQDFERLVEIFLSLGSDARWVQLGDLVHGPDDSVRRRNEALYDFDDRSFGVVAGMDRMMRSGRVYFVLGNHDHGHVGGPHTAKFHPDEVAYLESKLADDQISMMHRLFRRALLAVVTPCGLLLTHGAPGDELLSLSDLDRVALEGEKDPRLRKMLHALLTSYGQPVDVIERLLARLSREADASLSVLIHGHDKDEAGWFTEGHNQLVPVIFGAPNNQKRCLVVDLAAQYGSVGDLMDGGELQRLYPESDLDGGSKDAVT